MADTRYTDLPAAGAITGDELVAVSQLSTSVAYTATTISAAAADNSFNDSASQFVAEGFAVGDRVRVTGFTGDVANNILVGTIATIAAGKMTIDSPEGDVIVDDAAGESVTIAKWGTRRTTLQDAVDQAGSGWRLVGAGQTATGVWSQAVDGNKATVDFTGLDGISELLILFRLVTQSVSGQLSIQLSVNNGSSFFAAGGDYQAVVAAGTETAQNFSSLHGTNATAARSGMAHILGINVNGAPKVIDRVNRDDSGSSLFVGSTSPVNALRCLPSAGGNLTGGAIYLFGR
jgi:hypothetical protein